MSRTPIKSLTALIGVLAGWLCAGCMVPHVTWTPVSLPRLPVYRSLAIPDTLPLGSTVRAHYHTMQTNAEAADFVIHRHEFIGASAELNSAGKDHLVEIAMRMRSAPFPVLIERTENNSDPELDQHRRNLIAQILADFGNSDADQRTIVSPAYSRGLNSQEAQQDYYRFINTRGGNGNFGGNNAGGNFGGNDSSGF